MFKGPKATPFHVLSPQTIHGNKTGISMLGPLGMKITSLWSGAQVSLGPHLALLQEPLEIQSLMLKRPKDAGIKPRSGYMQNKWLIFPWHSFSDSFSKSIVPTLLKLLFPKEVPALFSTLLQWYSLKERPILYILY